MNPPTTYAWRLSFLVYLLGLISIVLCIFWMPNDKIYDSGRKVQSVGSTRQYVPYILVMFALSLVYCGFGSMPWNSWTSAKTSFGVCYPIFLISWIIVRLLLAERSFKNQ